MADLTLGQVAGWIMVLKLECKQCGRWGRLRAEDLVAEHGGAGQKSSG